VHASAQEFCFHFRVENASNVVILAAIKRSIIFIFFLSLFFGFSLQSGDSRCSEGYPNEFLPTFHKRSRHTVSLQQRQACRCLAAIAHFRGKANSSRLIGWAAAGKSANKEYHELLAETSASA